MKEKVLKLWNQDYLPVLEISHRLGISKKQVMEYLGDNYTKNEGHYRATKFRDHKRMSTLEDWYQKDFSKSELTSYAENGRLTDYYLKICKKTKVSVNEIRKFLAEKKVVIPKAKKNTYSSEYHIGKKSNYYKRENELISMWKEQGLSIQRINQLTGVSKRTLKKLFDPLGYNPNEMKKKSINKALSIVHKQQSSHIINQVNKLNLSPKEIEKLFNEHKIYSYALKKSKQIHVKPSNIINELKKRLPNNFKKSTYLPTVNQLKESDIAYLQSNQDALHKYIQKLAYKQKVSKITISQALYKKHKEIFPPAWQKRIRNSMLTEQTINELISLYVDEYWTINELVKKFDLSEKKVKRILQDNNVLNVNEEERNKRTYGLRKIKIQKANTNNPKIHNLNINKVHRLAKVPKDYIGQIPEEVWNIIQEQPDSLLIDKLISLANSKESILNLLKAVEKVAGHKVSLVGISEYLPNIKGLSDLNKRISQNFANDIDIQNATSLLSKYEEKINNFLSELEVSFEMHNRSLVSGKELDFYLPKYNLAIEASPLETHNSNKYKHFGQLTVEPKDSKYHQNKYQSAADKGITLITLFSKDLLEPEWSTFTKPFLKYQILKKSRKVYYARQIHIEKISSKEYETFIAANGLENNEQAEFQYGIFDLENQLLGVAAFTLPRLQKYQKQNLIELNSLWKNNVQVYYGLSKVVSFAKSKFEHISNGLISYSDNCIGSGKGYEKAGFKFVGETQPQLHYVNPIHPQEEFDKPVSSQWTRKLVETELPHRTDKGKGYVAQYDCGRKRWVYKF